MCVLCVPLCKALLKYIQPFRNTPPILAVFSRSQYGLSLVQGIRCLFLESPTTRWLPNLGHKVKVLHGFATIVEDDRYLSGFKCLDWGIGVEVVGSLARRELSRKPDSKSYIPGGGKFAGGDQCSLAAAGGYQGTMLGANRQDKMLIKAISTGPRWSLHSLHRSFNPLASGVFH